MVAVITPPNPDTTIQTQSQIQESATLPEIPTLSLKFKNFEVEFFNKNRDLDNTQAKHYDFIIKYSGKSRKNQILSLGINIEDYKIYNKFISFIEKLDTINFKISHEKYNKQNYISRQNLAKIFSFLRDNEIQFKILNKNISPLCEKTDSIGLYNYCVQEFQDSIFNQKNIKLHSESKIQQFDVIEIQVERALTITKNAVYRYLERKKISSGQSTYLKLAYFPPEFDLSLLHPYRDELHILIQESSDPKLVLFHKEGKSLMDNLEKDLTTTKTDLSKDQLIFHFLNFVSDTNDQYIKSLESPIQDLLKNFLSPTNSEDTRQQLMDQLNLHSNILSEVELKLLNNESEINKLIINHLITKEKIDNVIYSDPKIDKILEKFAELNNSFIKKVKALEEQIRDGTEISSQSKAISYHKSENIKEIVLGVAGLGLATTLKSVKFNNPVVILSVSI